MKKIMVCLVFLLLLSGCAASKYYTSYPLHGAIYNQDIPLATSLITKGTNVNALDDVGNTPLLIAAASCYPAIFKLLAENGAKTDIKNAEGNTILHNAVLCFDAKTHNTIAQALQLPHIDITMTNKYGQTAYHMAMEYMNMAAVAALRNKGVTEAYINRSADTFDEALRRPSFYTPAPGLYNVSKENENLYSLAIADCNHLTVPYKKGLLMVTGPIGYGLGLIKDQVTLPKAFNSCMKLMGFEN